MEKNYRLARASVAHITNGQAIDIKCPANHTIIQIIPLDKNEDGSFDVLFLYEIKSVIAMK